MLSLTFLTLALGLVAATATPPAAPSPAAPPASAEKTIVGVVVSLDQAQGKLVVQESSRTVRVKGEEPKKENVELSVDASTRIVIGRNPAALSELKAKDHVVVRYVVTPRGARATSLRVAERKAGPATPAAPSTPSTTTPPPAAPATGS